MSLTVIITTLCESGYITMSHISTEQDIAPGTFRIVAPRGLDRCIELLQGRSSPRKDGVSSVYVSVYDKTSRHRAHARETPQACR